ncbi:hypothetical protein [Sneathiella limimaris]|uniref:hypothetical protein n=1 Tax=Sneathiella limimaris TaxID=1964213 RepID=UPI001469C86E|nr:hypothetical protein [Sneathiella limimaris]
MRHLFLLSLVLSFIVLANPFTSLYADEVDEMVKILNEEVRKGNADEFAKKIAETSKDEDRFSEFNYVKFGKQAGDFIDAIKIYGDYVSHDSLKKRECGERIARVVSVFFMTEGHVAIDYWFFKPVDKWVLSSFNVKGQAGATSFIQKLSEISSTSC